MTKRTDRDEGVSRRRSWRESFGLATQQVASKPLALIALAAAISIPAGADTRLFGLQTSIAADAEIHELNPADCSTIRSYLVPVQPGFGFWGGLAFDGRSLWYSVFEGKNVQLVEMSADNGALRSRRDLPLQYVDGLASVNGRLYLLGEQTIHIYDPATSALIGEIPIGQANPGVNFSLALDKIPDSRRLLVAGSYESDLPDVLFEIDMDTGLIEKTYDDPTQFATGLAVANARIFVSRYYADLFVLDLHGELLFSCPTPRGFTGLAAGESENALLNIPATSPLGLALLAVSLAALALFAMRSR